MRKKRVCLLANSESRVCNRISIVRVWRNALPDNSSGLGSYEEKFLACCYALGKIQALVSSFWFFFFFTFTYFHLLFLLSCAAHGQELEERKDRNDLQSVY